MKNPHPGTGRHWRVPVGLIMLTSSVLLWPGTGMASPSCSISPQNPTVEPGEDVDFRAGTDDMRWWGRKYNWTFEEGSPSSSTRSRPEVEFEKAGGPWKVVLKVSDRRNEAECTTLVYVSGGDVGSAAARRPARTGRTRWRRRNPGTEREKSLPAGWPEGRGWSSPEAAARGKTGSAPPRSAASPRRHGGLGR